jgi:hypothetical protein
MQTKFFLLLSIFLSGCSPITPEVRLFGTLPQGIDTPIYVTAARQKNEIISALRGAGFHIVDHMDDSLPFMRVTIGTDQGSQPCGTLNNVRYELRFEGRDVAEATAKGWTASCKPNIFDEVSREMRRRLFGTTTQ